MWIVMWIMLQMTTGNVGKCGKSMERDKKPVKKKYYLSELLFAFQCVSWYIMIKYEGY